MITETKYYSDDRKFSSIDQSKVEEYEKKQNEKQNRKNNVDELVSQALNAINEYRKDYGSYTYKTESGDNADLSYLADFFASPFRFWR